MPPPDESASRALPTLATEGRFIVDYVTRTPVRLRGVNLSGFEYSEPRDGGFLEATGFTREEVLHLTRGLGAGIVRLPFNQDWALNGRNGHSAEDYLESIDQVIDWAREGGAYTLLDLQWLDADTERGGRRQFVAPLPNQDSIRLWRMLAERYCSNTSVLYDLFNEPHNRLPGDPGALRKPNGRRYGFPWKWRVSVKDWTEWAVALATAIREVDTETPIFVSGLNWGYDLRALHVELPGIVYSTHVYPDKSPDWETAFGYRAMEVPVFAGELGGDESRLAWGRELIAYLDELEIGWAAWSWRDWPHLQKDGRLTPFGEVVAASLANTGKGRRDSVL